MLRRKKTIAYLLSGIVLLPLILSSLLQVFQQCIKNSVANRLATEKLITLSIPLDQVQWMEEGREIMVNGKMFDIKNYEEKEGYLMAKGVYDEHETTVVKLLYHFGDEDQNIFLINLMLLTQTFVAALLFYPSVSALFAWLKHFVFYLLNNPIPVLKVLHQPPRQ